MRTLIIGNGDGIGLALTRRLLSDGEFVTGVSRRALLTGGLAGGFLLAFHLPLRARQGQTAAAVTALHPSL